MCDIPELTPDEQQARFWQVCKLGWQAAVEAEAMIKRGAFQGLTRLQLSERYKALCELVPDGGILLRAARIDDRFIAWERRHGAEARALEYLLYGDRISA